MEETSSSNNSDVDNLTKFVNGCIHYTMRNIIIYINVLSLLFEYYKLPIITIGTLLSFKYFSKDIYILFETDKIIFKYFDLYYESHYNKTLYYRHKCSCDNTECNGIYEFYGKITGYFSLIHNECYIMGLTNCIYNNEYVCEAYYDDKTLTFYNCNAISKFNNIFKYRGEWSFGKPNGNGVLTTYDKDGTTINIVKKYGYWKDGELDKTKHYELKLYYNQSNYFEEKIAIYKNIQYIESPSEDETMKCLIFGKKDKQIKSIYEGGINTRYEKHGCGKITFMKHNNYKSFDGIFFNNKPVWGQIYFTNGISYIGFVGKNYNLTGSGILNKSNYNINTEYEFPYNFFKNKRINIIFAFFSNDKLIKYINKNNDICDKYNRKLNCDNYNSYCLDCKKILCIKCGIMCYENKHDIIFNNISEDNYNILEKYKDVLTNKFIKCYKDNIVSKVVKKSSGNTNIIKKVMKETDYISDIIMNKINKTKMLTNKINEIEVNAAIKIQKYYRNYYKKQIIKNNIIKNNSASIIQKAYRKYINLKKYNIIINLDNENEFNVILQEILNCKKINKKNIIFAKEGIKLTPYNGFL